MSKYKIQPASVPSAMEPVPRADLTLFNPLTKWEDFTIPKEQRQEGRLT